MEKAGGWTFPRRGTHSAPPAFLSASAALSKVSRAEGIPRKENAGWKLLNGKLVLWDVDDGEALARHIGRYTIRRQRIRIDSEHRWEDLDARLIAKLWQLSGLDGRFQPIDPRPRGAYNPDFASSGWTFEKWARIRLYYEVINWLRETNGRTKWAFADSVHEREPIRVISLDYVDEFGADGEKRSMGEAVRSGNVDPHEHSGSLDLRGALLRGASPEAWAAAEEDRSDARGSSGRAQAA